MKIFRCLVFLTDKSITCVHYGSMCPITYNKSQCRKLVVDRFSRILRDGVGIVVADMEFESIEVKK